MSLQCTAPLDLPARRQVAKGRNRLEDKEVFVKATNMSAGPFVIHEPRQYLKLNFAGKPLKISMNKILGTDANSRLKRMVRLYGFNNNQAS